MRRDQLETMVAEAARHARVAAEQGTYEAQKTGALLSIVLSLAVIAEVAVDQHRPATEKQS